MRCRGGSRTIAPHLLSFFFFSSSSSSNWSGAQLGSFVPHHLPISSSQSPSILSPVPIPPKTTLLPLHLPSFFQTPQSPAFLPFPTQVMCSSMTNLQIIQFINISSSFSHPSLPRALSILSFDGSSPSTAVTDLCLFSFHVLPSFLCSTWYTVGMCASACTCNSMLVCIMCTHVGTVCVSICVCLHCRLCPNCTVLWLSNRLEQQKEE